MPGQLEDAEHTDQADHSEDGQGHGLLPVLANLEYSVAMFRLKENTKGLKVAFIVNMIMYSVFSFMIMNYIGAAANIVVAVTTAVSLIHEKKEPAGNQTANESTARDDQE